MLSALEAIFLAILTLFLALVCLPVAFVWAMNKVR